MKTHRQAMARATVSPEELRTMRQKGFVTTQKVGQTNFALHAVLTPEQRANGIVTGSGRPCRRLADN
jgi:hypothetical protein